MRKKKLDQKGVSPLIGVILMVAATIVIAGVFMLMLSGLKAPASGKVVGLNQNRINETAITFTVMRIESAGTDLNSVVMIAPMLDTTWGTPIGTGSTHTYVSDSLKGTVYVVLKGTFSDGSSEVIFSNNVQG